MSYKTKQEVIEAIDSFYANPAISKEKMKVLLGDISDHLVLLGDRAEDEKASEETAKTVDAPAKKSSKKQ